MSLASWFHLSRFHYSAALNKPGGRQAHRRPIYSRPSLEHLEERTLLDAGASSGVVAGANNPTFNSAPVSNGAVLPTRVSFAQTTAVTSGQVYPNAAEGIALSTVAANATVAQLNSQFRSFGVNSQGTDIRADLNWQMQILMANVYGFGSGTQPNAPWALASNNLGLANHQFNNPSQSDMGFPSAPPWSYPRSTYPIAQSQQKNQTPLLNRELNGDKPEAAKPVDAGIQRDLRQQEQPRQIRMNEDTSGKNEDWKAPLYRQDAAKQSALDKVMAEDGKIPDSLWLTALAPVPMTALVAGLPGSAIAAEGGEVSPEVPK